MSKRILPPLGRQLLFARKRGQHPARVWVLYGDDCWQRQPTDAPVLCVPGDYTPGRYNWSLLAGVPADIVWRGGEWIHALAAEVAMFAAPVNVHYRLHGFDTVTLMGFFGGGTQTEPVDAFLFLERWRTGVASIWTDDAEADYRDRENAWYASAVEDCLSHGRQKQTA